MPLHLYLAFVFTSAIVICTPGPTVLMVIADALAHHKRHAWSTVFGVGLGDLVGMTLSVAGAGAILRASATAFTILKVTGGLYLVYLGLRSIHAARSRGGAIETLGEASPKSAGERFYSAFLVTVTNPKLILFFVAFVPQFISPAESFVRQSVVCIATFDVMAMINASAYALGARSAGRKLTSAENQRRVGLASGAILIVAGVVVLAMRFKP